jgi:hypothetical protein
VITTPKSESKHNRIIIEQVLDIIEKEKTLNTLLDIQMSL